MAEKAHFDYKAALKARDAMAAEPNEIAEGAKTAGRAEALRKETDELYRKGDEERVGFELQFAGSRYGKAAHVLLIDYDNDVEKFEAAPSHDSSRRPLVRWGYRACVPLGRKTPCR